MSYGKAIYLECLLFVAFAVFSSAQTFTVADAVCACPVMRAATVQVITH
jgi:hypothetical protein